MAYNEKDNEFDYLFSEKGLDEMQKTKNYEIGFKLFRVLFWFIIGGALLMFTVGSGFENKAVIAIGIVHLILCTVFYLIYEVKASAAGVMNSKYTKYTLKKVQIFVCAIGAFSTVLMISNGQLGIEFAIVWADLLATTIGNYLCAKRNNKVLEKMLKDNDEEE